MGLTKMIQDSRQAIHVLQGIAIAMVERKVVTLGDITGTVHAVQLEDGSGLRFNVQLLTSTGEYVWKFVDTTKHS